MITFFRRALNSWYVLGIFALVLIAFIVTGVDPSLGGFTGGGANETVGKVGREKVGAIELQRRAQRGLEQARLEQQDLDMAGFVAGGGIEQTMEQILTTRALEQFGRSQGLGASKRLVDGEIASIAAFNGPNGKFDQSVFAAAIAQQGITEKELRADIEGELIRRQLFVPVAAEARAPAQLVTPYAALLLEARQGTIGIVPAEAMGEGAAPTDAELTKFYTDNRTRYTVPERRVIRYALIDRETVAAASQPNEAEIAEYYKANAATYAARETRVLQQVVLPDEAAAKALADKVRAGSSFADAAKAAGFSATDIAVGEKTRAEYAELASEAAAAAAWALPKGGVSAPAKSDFGWNVVHVEDVKSIAGRPLAAVREEVVAAVGRRKADDALADTVGKVEEAIANGSSFDEAVAAQKLTVVTTPPVTATGTAPDKPEYRAPLELSPLLKAAFAASTEDDPTVETIAPNDAFALTQVTEVVPAAPRPISEIRDQVSADFKAKRAADKARQVAQAILAKLDGGATMEAAFAGAGVKLPPLQKAGGRRADLARAQGRVPPPLQMLFSMVAGKSKVMPAPNDAGWYVVHLDTIEKGDVTKAPGIVQATQGEFSRLLGQEYVEQFARATRAAQGVSTDAAAINRVRAALTNNGPAAQ